MLLTKPDSVKSGPTHQPGQDNRSSDNFEFLQLPTGGNPIRTRIFNLAPNPENPDDPDDLVEVENRAITCALAWDRPAQVDPLIITFQSRTNLDPAELHLELGNDYYISTPSGAGGKDFYVRFSGNV